MSMQHSRRRVSYVVPPPVDAVPCLQLPPHAQPRLGSLGPLLIPNPNRTISPQYQTPKWARHPRHRLGVASLAIDTFTNLVGRPHPEGILYTGGRDGLVISWDLEIPMKKRTHGQSSSAETLHSSVSRWEIMTGWGDDVIDEEADEADDKLNSDGDILGDVKEAGGRRRARYRPTDPLPSERQWETDLDAFIPGQPTRFRQCAQVHSDWVNDLLLCNANQTVVSASSSGTVKAWNPHAPEGEDPSIIGTHVDYVRCLAHCREQNWVASGSFDRTIKIWDLGRTSGTDALVTLNPPDATAPKSSVYALAADPFGRTIVSGSPERVVRMWDPRSGKRTGKLVGHTDNIRSILISEDSKYILTGSADASVKLWSLSSQRCLHTFTHHTDSVWSLFSNHPSLEIFYSGDKSGLVCKVDVEDCSDVAEGECIVLCQDTSAEGINKIVAMDDNLLWTASGSSSIKRWRVPQRRAVRASALVMDMEADRERERSASTSVSESPTNPFMSRKRMSSSEITRTSPQSTCHELGTSSPPRNSVAGSLASENWMPQRDREDETTLYGIPFESLVRLASPNDPFAPFSPTVRGRDADVATLYSAASIMSVPRVMRSPLHAAFSHAHPSPMRSEHNSRIGAEDTVAPVRAARADYEERELASDAVPLYAVPDEVVHGDPGLVRSVMLNDRMHALTVDTSGEVAVWNIVRGQCLGRFPCEEVAAASHCGSTAGGSGERERSPREALEAVRERIEGEAVVAQWSAVDTKTGVLTVHLNERCFDAEIYADEAGFGPDRHFNDEVRWKWVLRNLFLGFIREEQRIQRKRPSNNHESIIPSSLHRGSAPSHIDLNSNGRSFHRSRSSSNASSRKSDPEPTSGIVMSSPNMIPAVSPVVPHTRTSPLVAPMIPLYAMSRENSQPLASIPQSPMPLGGGDATPMPRARRSTANDNGPPTVTPGQFLSSAKEGDYFSVPVRSSGGAPPTPDDFGGWSGPGKSANDHAVPQTPSTPTPGGGLMGRLKNWKSTKKATGEVGPNSPATVAGTTSGAPLATQEATPGPHVSMTPLQTLLSMPLSPPPSSEAPTVSLASNTSVIISEEASPSWKTIYRGTVASSSADMRTLEEAMPMWLLEYLLANKVPPIPVTKVSFVLLPWPNKDPGGDQLPELLNTAQSKLTASRFLRVRKLTCHVQDKLDKIANSPGIGDSPPRSSTVDAQTGPRSSSSSCSSSVKSTRPRSEDLYEILCNEMVLPLDMTLAAVRQFVWRQTGELTMYYRKKGPAVVA